MVYESALDLSRLGDLQDEEVVDRIRAGETVLDAVNRLVDSGYLESTRAATSVLRNLKGSSAVGWVKPAIGSSQNRRRASLDPPASNRDPRGGRVDLPRQRCGVGCDHAARHTSGAIHPPSVPLEIPGGPTAALIPSDQVPVRPGAANPFCLGDRGKAGRSFG